MCYLPPGRAPHWREAGGRPPAAPSERQESAWLHPGNALHRLRRCVGNQALLLEGPGGCFWHRVFEQNRRECFKAKSAPRFGEFIAGFSKASSSSKFVQLGRVVRRQPGVDQYLTPQGPFLCSLQQVQSYCSKEVFKPSLFLQLDLLTWQRGGN